MSVFEDNVRLRLYAAARRYAGLVLFSLFFLLYAYTAAPTFVWSDPSKLAIYTQCREFCPFFLGYHALHCFLGSLLQFLPFFPLEVAYLQNLLCALYGALALFIIYCTLKRLGFGVLSSVFTVAYLGISQMFWLTSLIYESYALLSLTTALWIYFLVRWSLDKDNFLYLYLLTLAIFLSLLNHYLTLLYAPFIAVFTIYYAKRHSQTLIYWAGILILSSLVLIFKHNFVYMFKYDSRYVLRYFVNFANSSRFFKNLIIYPAYLFYQFPFLGFFLGIWGMFIFPRRRNRIFSLLLLLLILTVLFWTYHAGGRHPYIHNPVYMFFSFFICIGIERLYSFGKKRALGLLIFFLVITPLIYYLTPRILTAWGINIRRNLPYRNANIYYLWPNKRGYYGAQRFAEEALNRVDHNGILIADFTIAMPLCYLQLAGQYRQDVFVFLPEHMSRQGSLPGEILWPRLRNFLDYNISLRGSVYIADKYSLMFVTGYSNGKPITSWDLIKERYQVDWLWPIYKISSRRK